jgi:hypothetical protein
MEAPMKRAKWNHAIVYAIDPVDLCVLKTARESAYGEA